MSSVFKVTVTGYRTPEGRKCNKHDAVTTDESGRKVLRPGYRRVKKKSRKWYGQYRDGKGRLRRVPLCRDKTASEQLLSKFITDAVLDKHGLVDRFEKHSGRPLAEHLADYQRELENRDRAPEYVELVISRLTALMDGCGFRVIGDISASPVNDWLAAQRRTGETGVVLPPGKAWYTPKEAAAFLQISLAAIRAGIKRQGLEAVGHGKARKFPRATVEALLERRSRGTSVQTTNYYLSHLKSFCRWLVEDGRMPESLFPRIRAGKVVDRRHDRRELTLDELKLLLKVTRSSPRSFRGLSGRDRFFLYVTACATGFRARAIASLTPESFDLDSVPATVTLAARFNKNRTPKVQPVKREDTDQLREYLRDKPARQPVWGGTWARDHRGAEMLRLDLEAAGIPYAVETPKGPLYADFHALRHSYVTIADKVTDSRTVQELAGHKTASQTARYSDRRLNELAEAVEKMPSFLPDEDEGEDRLVCTGLAQTADVSGQGR